MALKLTLFFFLRVSKKRRRWCDGTQIKELLFSNFPCDRTRRLKTCCRLWSVLVCLLSGKRRLMAFHEHTRMQQNDFRSQSSRLIKPGACLEFPAHISKSIPSSHLSNLLRNLQQHISRLLRRIEHKADRIFLLDRVPVTWNRHLRGSLTSARSSEVTRHKIFLYIGHHNPTRTGSKGAEKEKRERMGLRTGSQIWD